MDVMNFFIGKLVQDKLGLVLMVVQAGPTVIYVGSAWSVIFMLGSRYKSGSMNF
jgi:hypothetical protein